MKNRQTDEQKRSKKNALAKKYYKENSREIRKKRVKRYYRSRQKELDYAKMYYEKYKKNKRKVVQ